MVTPPVLSELSLKDMWLFLVAIMLVMLVVGQGGTAVHSAPPEQVEDGAVSSRVKVALLKEVGINAMGVGIETVAGRVDLSGRVGSEAEKRKAEEAARAVNGVTSVSNRLVVR